MNGRIEDVLQSHHFRSGEELEATLDRYVWLYNQQLPQSALGSKTPLQTMKDWHKLKPALFKRQPYYRPGCDSYFILADAPENNEYNVPVLPEGTEPTPENYVDYFEEIGGDVKQVESVVFYQNDENDVPQEAFRIDAPDDGFADADALVQAYDDAIAAMEAEGTAAEDLMMALTIAPDAEEDSFDEDDLDEPEDILPV